MTGREMMRRAAALPAIGLILTGCGLMADLPRIGEPRVTSDLEVYNRTQQDIFLVAADGERLDVPACGQARDPSFRIDQVQVRTEAGYIRAFGVGDASFEGQQLYVIELPSAMGSGIPTAGPPPVLPACDGPPQVQVGV